jgi:uncharacterized protein DUF4326
MPEPVQRRRTRGWRMPPNTVYVGRPTIYGNPFKLGEMFCGPTIRVAWTPAEAMAAFEDWITRDTLHHLCWDRRLIVAHAALKAALDRGDLRGKNLACWCPLGYPCHRDVLLRLANGGCDG